MNTIEIDIVKSGSDYNYRNFAGHTTIGKVYLHNGKYHWDTYGEHGAEADVEQAHAKLQDILTKRAGNLGCDIEFDYEDEE